jgi:hypothetical protein
VGPTNRYQRLSYKELDSSVAEVWHAALHNLAANVLGFTLERHVEVLLGRDLRFRGHLKGSIAWRAAPGFRPSRSEIGPFDPFRAAERTAKL